MGDIKFEAVKKISDLGFKVKDLSKISKVDSISPPSVFIGSKLKYPTVNVGILSPLQKDEDAWLYDDVKYWAKRDFGIKEVMKIRNSLLNSRFQAKVNDVRLNRKFLDVAKDLAISSKQVDLEIQLKNRVRLGRGQDKVLTPHGMRANLKKVDLTGNVKVDRKIDRVVNDEIKASEGIEILYKNEYDEYVLSKILSVGVIGLKKNKRLVPTRWSITATDDIIGKELLKEIKNYPIIENHELFFGEFMGNQYLIMLFPRVWSYELFELYFPKSSWNPTHDFKASTDYENYNGRKNYAFNTAGGYYATRLPILKYLSSIRRQANVLVIRLETPSYWASLGVWVVRESVKKALQNIKKFDSRNELIEGAKKIGKIKFDFNIEEILKRSLIIKEQKTQKSLREYF